ncbi:MAG: 4Fe-4S binding protein [Muribaculaceae bacterium]|nr:4Fe-4S binding protein [Muribaculaceae bacterium]
MKNLRTIRILLATVAFAATVAYLVFGLSEHPVTRAVAEAQIVPSLMAETAGVTLFWLIMTWLFGRVYCAVICPVGTLQDLAAPLRKYFPGARKNYRFKSAKKIRNHIFIVYLLCLVIGVTVVPIVIEPWNIMRSISSIANADASAELWTGLGLGVGVGILAGVISLLLILLSAIYFGRDFCNVICPVGTALSLVGSSALYHIEIDPDKCSGCLKCEEICQASCIKVTDRYVDNARCIRCFDCIAECPDGAIRYQRGRNRAATPLLRQVGGRK